MSTKRMRLEKGTWLKGAVAAAVMSAFMSYGVTFYLVGMPGQTVENAVNNAISGGMSGLMSALIATAMYQKITQR